MDSLKGPGPQQKRYIESGWFIPQQSFEFSTVSTITGLWRDSRFLYEELGACFCGAKTTNTGKLYEGALCCEFLGPFQRNYSLIPQHITHVWKGIFVRVRHIPYNVGRQGVTSLLGSPLDVGAVTEPPPELARRIDALVGHGRLAVALR